jgi:GNAT superfamily N-acetyltransferase
VDAPNAHWRWYEIALRMPERFVLRDVANGDLVAVWSSRAKRPIVLDGAGYYRPDYLEVDPGRREGGLGLFLLAVIATRARELGAQGLVLGGVDTPAARALYSRAGASESTPGGWRPAPGLIPYWIGGDAYVELCEYADAHQEP